MEISQIFAGRFVLAVAAVCLEGADCIEIVGIIIILLQPIFGNQSAEMKIIGNVVFVTRFQQL